MIGERAFPRAASPTQPCEAQQGISSRTYVGAKIVAALVGKSGTKISDDELKAVWDVTDRFIAIGGESVDAVAVAASKRIVDGVLAVVEERIDHFGDVDLDTLRQELEAFSTKEMKK